MPTRTFLGSCGCVSSEDTVQDLLRSCTATAVLPSAFFGRSTKTGVWPAQTSQVTYSLSVLTQKSWESSDNQELILEWFVDCFSDFYFTSHGVTVCLFLFSNLCGLSCAMLVSLLIPPVKFNIAVSCGVCHFSTTWVSLESCGRVWQSDISLFFADRAWKISENTTENVFCLRWYLIPYRSVRSTTWKGIFNIFWVFSVSWLIKLFSIKLNWSILISVIKIRNLEAEQSANKMRSRQPVNM